ncbi:hypothetical protein GCM10023170_067400 [Phytohabitans houttuyneae]
MAGSAAAAVADVAGAVGGDAGEQPEEQAAATAAVASSTRVRRVRVMSATLAPMGYRRRCRSPVAPPLTTAHPTATGTGSAPVCGWTEAAAEPPGAAPADPIDRTFSFRHRAPATTSDAGRIGARAAAATGATFRFLFLLR